MGAVHGVSLKYVAISAASGWGARSVATAEGEALGNAQLVAVTALCYVSLLNGMIAMLFQTGMGMRVLGKCATTGAVPVWSYVVFLGFHLPTWLYTRIHHVKDRWKRVPSASEVHPGWWVGGRYAAELDRKWSGVVDMTCEFPEGCSATTDRYLLLPCWDGVPPGAEGLERAANFAVAARAYGDVLVHCAHGRGRSTTVMCACLVKADLYPTWELALEAVKRHRKVAKLNGKMRRALREWQDQYATTTPKRAATAAATMSKSDSDLSFEDGSTPSSPPSVMSVARGILKRLRMYDRSKMK